MALCGSEAFSVGTSFASQKLVMSRRLGPPVLGINLAVVLALAAVSEASTPLTGSVPLDVEMNEPANDGCEEKSDNPGNEIHNGILNA